MKTKIAVLFLLVAVMGLSQQIAPTPVQLYGINAPDPGRCNDQVNIASTYTQAGDPANGFSGQYTCLQSGPNTFGWAAISITAPGTTGTTGHLIVSNGKTVRIANSINLIGTDNATTYLPTTTGGVPALTFCGATSGSTTCANTVSGNTARVIAGIATLSSNSAVISGIIPNFTSTSTFECQGQDTTTISNPVKILNTSSSSITISNTTGASDVISWSCIGY